MRLMAPALIPSATAGWPFTGIVHGVLPSEYDIREIDEALYLAVLAARKAAEQHS